jgi:RimJ/RimL family protein N-acetyltransferase
MELPLETERLIIEPYTREDASFIVKLLNDPLWIAGIGDRNIKTNEDAENYLVNGPFKLYEKYGFGPFKVSLKDTKMPIGMCGLIKRDSLQDVDIGFAFLSEYCGKGYGKESSLKVMEYAKNVHHLSKIVAIVSPSNIRSLKLLLSLKFQETERFVLDGKDTILLSFDL